MPPLPKQNKKREADFGIQLRAWLENNPRFSCALELKQTTTNSILLSSIDQKQIAFGLQMRSDKGILIRVQGIQGEPDYIWCRNMPSYIVVRYPKSFHLIPVESIALEQKRSKSLNAQRAEAISTVSVSLPLRKVR